MMDIALVEVDFDDPTTNVRGRRALAIAKPTSEGLLTMPKHDHPDHEGLFPASKRMIEAKVSRSFDEMITIDLVESTLTIRLQTSTNK